MDTCYTCQEESLLTPLYLSSQEESQPMMTVVYSTRVEKNDTCCEANTRKGQLGLLKSIGVGHVRGSSNDSTSRVMSALLQLTKPLC